MERFGHCLVREERKDPVNQEDVGIGGNLSTAEDKQFHGKSEPFHK